MTAEDIVKALDLDYSYHPRRYSTFKELRIGTGYGKGKEQKIDYWVISHYPSDGMSKISYEIKVSRSDFLKGARSSCLTLSPFFTKRHRGVLIPTCLSIR